MATVDTKAIDNMRHMATKGLSTCGDTIRLCDALDEADAEIEAAGVALDEAGEPRDDGVDALSLESRIRNLAVDMDEACEWHRASVEQVARLTAEVGRWKAGCADAIGERDAAVADAAALRAKAAADHALCLSCSHEKAAQVAENDALRARVERAYREGYADGCYDGEGVGDDAAEEPDLAWLASDAFATLAAPESAPEPLGTKYTLTRNIQPRAGGVGGTVGTPLLPQTGLTLPQTASETASETAKVECPECRGIRIVLPALASLCPACHGTGTVAKEAKP